MKWIKMKTQHNIICEMPLNVYSRKEERSQINDFSFHNKNLEKDEQIKPKVRQNQYSIVK